MSERFEGPWENEAGVLVIPELRPVDGKRDEDVRITLKGPQLLDLEANLGMDPIAFFAKQKGKLTLCTQAIFVGLGKKKMMRASPKTISRWLTSWEGSQDRLVKEILYCTIRGQKGADARKMAEFLDSLYASVEEEESEGDDGETIIMNGEKGKSSGPSSIASLPPSARTS